MHHSFIQQYAVSSHYVLALLQALGTEYRMKQAEKPCPHGACTLVEEVGSIQIRKNVYVVLLVVAIALDNNKAGGRVGECLQQGREKVWEALTEKVALKQSSQGGREHTDLWLCMRTQ